MRCNIHYYWGPFGRERHVDILKNYMFMVLGIDHYQVETCTIMDGIVTFKDHQGSFRFRFFEDRPYLCVYDKVESIGFTNESFFNKMTYDSQTGRLIGDFLPSLSNSDTACLRMLGHVVTPESHAYVSGILNTQFIGDEGYKLKHKAGAFFQFGYGEPNTNHILIEFMLERGVADFMTYFNRYVNFTPTITPALPRDSGVLLT